MAFDYDMIVIGGGAAGLTAAGMSALLGAKTVLVESDRLGGDCTWVGCVPSKTLLRTARLAQQIRTANRYGLQASEPSVEFAQVMEHVRRTRERIYEGADSPPHLEALGVEVVKGRASFSGSHEIEINNGAVRKLSSRLFVIATGSRPRVPEFAPSALTNESVFELTSRPERLVVLGGGPVGIELAQAFARLGSGVTVVVEGQRILPRDDPDHAERLKACLAAEGVEFEMGRKVTAMNEAGAVLDDGRALPYDAVLAAMGREAAVDGLRLEKAGVAMGERGVTVDRRCRTSQKHIYAVGDVTGRHQFTHMAEHTAKVAVRNAVLRWPTFVDEKHLVWCTFTDPELAHLGESEAELRERNARFTALRFPFQKLDRAVTEGETEGEVKVFAGKSGRILGASILGAQAGEMIAEYAVAMRNRLRVPQISDTIHAYPTFALGNRRAADQFVEKQLDSRPLGLLGKVLRYRGRRGGSAALRGEV